MSGSRERPVDEVSAQAQSHSTDGCGQAIEATRLYEVSVHRIEAKLHSNLFGIARPLCNPNHQRTEADPEEE